MKRIYPNTFLGIMETTKNKQDGFIACDNKEYNIWIEKVEELLKDMDIDTSKIIVSITINDTNWFQSNRINTAGKTVKDNNKFNIYIKNNLEINEFIRTYLHEHGHVTQLLGYGNKNIFDYANNKNRFLKKIIILLDGLITFLSELLYGKKDTLLEELVIFISESIANRFEEKGLRKFNKKYKMNIPVQFNKKYGKDFCFLITKKEFKNS